MTVARESVLRMCVTLAFVLTIVGVGAQLWTTDLGTDERLDGTTRAGIVGVERAIDLAPLSEAR